MFFSKPSPKLDSSSCSKDLNQPLSKIDAKKVKGKQPDSFNSIMKSQGKSLIKPLTRENVFYYYVPALGTASYTVLSISVLNPYFNCGFFPKKDLTHILLTTALFGTGCYIYSRPHIKASSKKCRYGYSALGSFMFNFSSILFWAMLRTILPWNAAVRSAAGLATSFLVVKGATDYLEFVDNKISL